MILHKFPVRKCKIVGVICVVLSVIFIFLALFITKKCPECGTVSSDYKECPKCGHIL